MENRVNEFNINVCDSVAKCLTPGSDIADSITNIVNNYLTENEFLTKDSSTITNIQNDITNLENRVNEFNINVCDSVAKCMTLGSDIADSIANIVNNYLTENEFLTKDSATITNIQQDITNLENRVNEFNINVCDSVAKCLTPGSDIADSIANIVNNYLTENEFLTKDSATITNIQQDITNLENRVNEFNINVCDSVAKCLTPGSDIADSIANIVNNYLTTNEYINEQALIDSNYVKTTELPTEQSAKFTATAGQTVFTISSTPNTNYLVKIYINGILIGDNNTSVVTVSGTTVTYVPAENEDYALEAVDKILIYWFK